MPEFVCIGQINKSQATNLYCACMLMSRLCVCILLLHTRTGTVQRTSTTMVFSHFITPVCWYWLLCVLSRLWVISCSRRAEELLLLLLLFYSIEIWNCRVKVQSFTIHTIRFRLFACKRAECSVLIFPCVWLCVRAYLCWCLNEAEIPVSFIETETKLCEVNRSFTACFVLHI